jgi:hypothetical protein
MKVCLECQFVDRKVVDTQQGPQLVGVCTYEECRDPINGMPLPLQTARIQEAFCGIKGRYHKLQEQKPKAEGNVIQLDH